jgi:hypothetical protein
MLARNGRLSYRNIANTIGMTTERQGTQTIRSQIQSLKGVKEANVFLPMKIQYNESNYESH